MAVSRRRDGPVLTSDSGVVDEPTDDAVTASFLHTLKVELVHREWYMTRRMAKTSIFKYIETYDNRKRKHSAIGHRIPTVFKKTA
ncbi:MAG: IS3 family transposase [Nitrospirales bacterium]